MEDVLPAKSPLQEAEKGGGAARRIDKSLQNCRCPVGLSVVEWRDASLHCETLFSFRSLLDAAEGPFE